MGQKRMRALCWGFVLGLVSLVGCDDGFRVPERPDAGGEVRSESADGGAVPAAADAMSPEPDAQHIDVATPDAALASRIECSCSGSGTVAPAYCVPAGCGASASAWCHAACGSAGYVTGCAPCN